MAAREPCSVPDVSDARISVVRAGSARPALTERELFEAVYRRMRNLAGALSPDLDDLVQLAAVQVFQSLPAFRGQCDILTWVYTICYRVLMQQRAWYRSWTKRFVLTDCEFDEQSSAQPLPTALLYARERTRRLHAGLSRMTDKYRAVVVLHDLEELDIAEVAVIVDANVLTVRSRLRDGRKQLQRILAADPEFERCGERHEIGV